MAAVSTRWPQILVYAKSPAGVYASQKDFIEANLANLFTSMKKRFEDVGSTLKSRASLILLLTEHKDSPDSVAQRKVWKDFVTRRLKMDESGPAPDEPSKFVEAMKNMDLRPMSETDLGTKFLACGAASLCSMIEFQTATDEWVKPPSIKIKLPAPHDNVFAALGLAQFDKYANDLEHTNLTLGRLLRAFRGTLVVSRGDYGPRFTSCLIDVNSAFMENVILTKGKVKNGMIPVTSVYVLDTTLGITPEKVTVYDESNCTIYLEMPLEFVLTALQETMTALKEIIAESGDDVI